MAFCPQCGANVPEGTQQCPQCGSQLNAQQPQQNTAPQGTPYQAAPQGNPYQAPPQGAPYQAAPQGNPYQAPPQGNPYQMPPQPVVPAGYNQKSKIAAGILGILLGALGVHNFYLGYTGKAVAQLLITLLGGVITCGVAAVAVEIWGLVEGIMILTGSIKVDGHNVPLAG